MISRPNFFFCLLFSVRTWRRQSLRLRRLRPMAQGWRSQSPLRQPVAVAADGAPDDDLEPVPAAAAAEEAAEAAADVPEEAVMMKAMKAEAATQRQ
jgi:hypothetical protein